MGRGGADDILFGNEQAIGAGVIEARRRARMRPHRITDNGTRLWLDSDDELHRDEDLPAVEKPDGSKEWHRHGRLHRDGDKPAIELADGGRAWFVNGRRHRIGAPAVIGADGRELWFEGGSVVASPNNPHALYDYQLELAESVDAGEDVVVFAARSGLGKRHTVRKVLSEREGVVVVCPKVSELNWRRALPKAEVYSREWVTRHGAEIADPEIAVIDSPRGKKGLAAAEALGWRAKQRVVFPMTHTQTIVQETINAFPPKKKIFLDYEGDSLLMTL
jgi:hypothetical protein